MRAPARDELVDRGAHRRLDLGVHAGLEVFVGHAEPDARAPALRARRGPPRGTGPTGVGMQVASSGSAPAITSSSAAASSTRAAERARLIERRRERDHAVARDAAVGRLDADDAAQRRRLADRAAGVGAERARAQRRRDRRRRAARRSARHARVRPRGCAPA